MNKNNFSLDQWLAWIAAIHPQEIALGLERIKTVAERLSFIPPSCPVIIVGGTNGKGSCVATLEKIYREQGYRTGVFTSPVLFRHNELLRIEEQEVADAGFCEAYRKIEAVRGEISLTPFEYHTLAVLELLSRQSLDLWILEVGLGGRLDAVNIVDADVALVSSIGIDHVDWLGATREEIGREKAGIFRNGRPAICGDFDPPSSLRNAAERCGAQFLCQGVDFHYGVTEQGFWWRGIKTAYAELPCSSLALQNSASALMAVECLQERLPVSEEAIQRGLKKVFLPGRIEVRAGTVLEIRDVAHNPAAVAFLAQRLRTLNCRGKKRAVFSMLADKDLRGSVASIKDQIDVWYVAPLSVKRATSADALRTGFAEEGITALRLEDSVAAAYAAARAASEEGDCVIIFGSFHTVAALRDVA